MLIISDDEMTATHEKADLVAVADDLDDGGCRECEISAICASLKATGGNPNYRGCEGDYRKDGRNTHWEVADVQGS